jgi:hypothetical protein
MDPSDTSSLDKAESNFSERHPLNELKYEV